MASVTLTKLEKTYSPGKKDAFQAVKHIDLEIRDKEFMVLVGPSGCGKSTTLRMLAGLEEITGGTITIGDRIVNDVPPKERSIAMVFQNYALYPHMNLFDNMAFGLKLRKFPRAEIKKRVDEAAAILGLTEMLDRKPKALSGGQRQRVAVGRAIVRHPDVFHFDEPLSNLDAKMRVSMRAEISKLHQRLDATMIYVTHDQIEAMTMGDRICVMKDGNIMQVATPMKLYNQPENVFVASFIGSPPMNFFRGLVHQQDGLRFINLDRVENGINLPLPGPLEELAEPWIGRELILGLRPEDIESTQRARAQAWPTQHAILEMAEPIGAETYLYAMSGCEQNFIARVHSDYTFPIGEPVTLAFDMSKAHLFDPETEISLTSPPA